MAFRSARLLVLLLLSLIALCRAGETLSTGEDVNEFIDQYIADYDIMVFAKSTCKYCKNSKKILDKVHKKSGMKGWNARFLYLDYMSTDGPKIHAALKVRTGQNTVPNVFINGKHVGGNTELTKLFQSGELLTIISGMVKSKAAE